MLLLKLAHGNKTVVDSNSLAVQVPDMTDREFLAAHKNNFARYIIGLTERQVFSPFFQWRDGRGTNLTPSPLPIVIR